VSDTASFLTVTACSLSNLAAAKCYTALVAPTGFQQDETGQLGFSFQPVRKLWTVRDLVGTVRTALEREYTDVWVEGEISNFRPSESGHLYFTLKDGDAQLRVVVFRMQARLLRFRPDNGLAIIARGRVTIYEGRGELQLVGEYLEPKGAGALQIAFEQLKHKLSAEGLFDSSRKKPIPILPRCIGIVTSPRGAAIQDMLNVLRRRHSDAQVLIYPAQVQGDTAAAEVSAGIRYFNRRRIVDVIVIARGGGSIEDLAAFNREDLARTIAASDLPVISAIGHETDFTIADFVADLRAPTPSAAAELVIAARQHLDDQLRALQRRLEHGIRYGLSIFRRRCNELGGERAFGRLLDTIRRRQQRVDDLAYRLTAAQRILLDRQRRRLEIAATRVRHHDLRRVLSGMRRESYARVAQLGAAMRNSLLRKRGRLGQLTARLQTLSPLAILERGYALVFDAKGKLIKSSEQAAVGATISARLASGSIQATVTSTKKG
jgi:exodeoxyribonuclease VII large subunit